MAQAAGKLNHKVQLQQKVETQDATTGEIIVTWTTIAEPWAEVVPLSAREFIAAQSEQSEVGGRIVIRYRANIDASMRILHRGMAYNILGVMSDPVSGLEYLTLPVSQGVRVAP